MNGDVVVVHAAQNRGRAIRFKSFKAFHRDWASVYKRRLEKRRNARTGKLLGLTTKDSTLRLVKGFVHWLASQPGYKSRITYADAAYFTNSARDARAARSARPDQYPALEQCAHTFRLMPEESEIARRNNDVLAFFMLTGARDSVAATLCLKHIHLVEGKVFQDGREVHTKNGKSIETWFFPVDPIYRAGFEDWVRYLRAEKLFGPGDALFPKCAVTVQDGRFGHAGLSRAPYTNGQPLNAIVKHAFREAGLPAYTAHSFRKTLAQLSNQCCKTLAAFTAYSQNFGHEHLATTVSAYMPVSDERQRDLIRSMTKD